MKKLFVALAVIFSLPVLAQDTFIKTRWKPFVDSPVAIEFSNSVTIRYTSYKDTHKKFVNTVEGFVRYKIDKEYVYQVFAIDCEKHIVSLWTQDSQHIVSEYINPAHLVWNYRNSVCK
jgi:hypothetical protein